MYKLLKPWIFDYELQKTVRCSKYPKGHNTMLHTHQSAGISQVCNHSTRESTENNIEAEYAETNQQLPNVTLNKHLKISGSTQNVLPTAVVKNAVAKNVLGTVATLQPYQDLLKLNAKIKRYLAVQDGYG